VCVGGCQSTANKPPDGKWGYIDTGGRMVINPQFDYARPFNEGLAAVLVGVRKDNRSFGYSPDLKWGLMGYLLHSGRPYILWLTPSALA
jgi:hypothetical protein